MLSLTVPTPPVVENVLRHPDVPAATRPTPTFSGMPVEVIKQCLDCLPLNDWPNVIQVNSVCRRLIQEMLSDFRYSLKQGKARFIRIGEEGEHNVSYSPMPADMPREIKKFINGIESLPDELVLHIFGFLSQANQGRASCVCGQWRDVAADPALLKTSDLKERYPLMQVLDEKICKTHFGALELDFKHPPLERKMIPELDRLYGSVQNGSLKIEENAGITLAFLPPGLTLNMLTQGYPDKFCFVSKCIPREWGDIPAEGGWFALTNKVIEKSELLIMSHQEQLVKAMGCDIPGLLEVIWVSLLTYMNSQTEPPTCLYSCTFSHVWQQTMGHNAMSQNVRVGGLEHPSGRLDVVTYIEVVSCGIGAQVTF